MQVYLVGGAVRDELLGRPVGERDYVVVGSSPAEMEAAGFKAVGKDFPVFLHPKTHEEYALARTERKTAAGYKGFAFHYAPDVTLEEDLARRDLTLNAIARKLDAEGKPTGLPIDPYRGTDDLRDKVFRHIGPAFIEDPVRILRVARFAARLPEFSIAPETLALMREMVANGEVDALVPERVWQELARGLMEDKPSRMFEVLRECDALARILPELDRLWGVPQRAEYHPEIDTGVHVMMVVDMAARLDRSIGGSLPMRFAALMHDLGKGTTPQEVLPKHIGHEGRSEKLVEKIIGRLRVPNDCAKLAKVVAREHCNIHRSAEFGAEAVLRLLERCDAIRKPERFNEVLLACEADARGRKGFEERPYPQADLLRKALETIKPIVPTKEEIETLDGPGIAQRLRQRRIKAIGMKDKA